MEGFVQAALGSMDSDFALAWLGDGSAGTSSAAATGTELAEGVENTELDAEAVGTTMDEADGVSLTKEDVVLLAGLW